MFFDFYSPFVDQRTKLILNEETFLHFLFLFIFSFTNEIRIFPYIYIRTQVTISPVKYEDELVADNARAHGKKLRSGARNKSNVAAGNRMKPKPPMKNRD